MSMAHPVLGCQATASIVSKWYEAGRWIGYELQFPGEKTTRHLKLKEIWELQGYSNEDGGNGR